MMAGIRGKQNLSSFMVLAALWWFTISNKPLTNLICLHLIRSWGNSQFDWAGINGELRELLPPSFFSTIFFHWLGVFICLLFTCYRCTTCISFYTSNQLDFRRTHTFDKPVVFCVGCKQQKTKKLKELVTCVWRVWPMFQSVVSLGQVRWQFPCQGENVH